MFVGCLLFVRKNKNISMMLFDSIDVLPEKTCEPLHVNHIHVTGEIEIQGKLKL